MEKILFAGDLSCYRNHLSDTYQKRYIRLAEQCERYFHAELPAVHPRQSTTFMGIAIINLALMYRLSDQERYLKEAIRWMDTVCSYPQWGNAFLVNVDLSAAWILFGLSLGYDWLKEELEPQRRKQYRQTIEEHARIIFAYRNTHLQNGWAVEYWQNHNWIDMTGLAAAGYALIRDGDKSAQIYTEAAKQNFALVYSLMAEDGSNYEGAVYWRYGGMWLYLYAYLLRTEEGIDYFRSCSYLAQSFWFRLYHSVPDLRRQINFCDAHDTHSGHTACIYYLFAKEYQNGYAQTLGNLVTEEFLDEEAALSQVKPGILPEACLELLFYDPQIIPKPLDDLPLLRFFPDIGIVCTRSGWTENDRVFCFKCSAPGGKKQWREGRRINRESGIQCLSLAHQHPDNLSYVFVNGKNYFTQEDGYNRNVLPSHHSVPLVDGRQCDAENAEDVYLDSIKIREKAGIFDADSYMGRIERMEETEDDFVFCGESAGTYAWDLKMHTVNRTVWVKKRLDLIVMITKMKSETFHQYSVLCNTVKPMEKRDEHSFFEKESGVFYQVLSNVPLTQKQFEQRVEAVMTTQEPDKKREAILQTLETKFNEQRKSITLVECISTYPIQPFLNDDWLVIRGPMEITLPLSSSFDSSIEGGI